MTKAQIALLDKAELLQKLDAKIKPTWKSKVAQRARVTLNAVIRWGNGTTRHSHKIEQAARDLVYEEYEIERLFPERARINS